MYTYVIKPPIGKGTTTTVKMYNSVTNARTRWTLIKTLNDASYIEALFKPYNNCSNFDVTPYVNNTASPFNRKYFIVESETLLSFDDMQSQHPELFI